MEPVFVAVSTTARQLFHLLSFLTTVSFSDILPAVIFLDVALFITYKVRRSNKDPNLQYDEEDENDIPPFEISLSSLLETLQVLGISDKPPKGSWSTRNGTSTSAFDSHATVGMTGLCRLSYQAEGDPLCIVLEEAGVTTTCELTTYESSFDDEIPLQKDALMQKIIMRSSWLHDAIMELASSSPTRLTIASSPQAPYFTLSSTGPFGSAAVEFSKDPQLLETFQVSSRSVNTYNYSLIRSASKAMAAATKVSLRSDEQGVLSLQFMIETDHEGKSSGIIFVDFRFVPYLDEEEENGTSQQTLNDSEL
ncbi:uncharacterized protein KY384_001532 [Bacidia gigantensis]|uniref:uncharacterized protein n=1 Tax=Bacidia gigantensis TaxID=2732470 RepID=UPI001D056EC8|nr:uncharacterized protein KY384_001532 [Bacidia gigantensis]KAG8533791.1 hypothetical protein KY384_001532 [Bacidia gigantensis]